MELNIEINLDDKEQAAAKLKEIQGSFDELLSVMKMQEKQLKENAAVMEKAGQENKDLLDTAVGLADTIKSIYRLLNTKKEMWASDVQVNELMNQLATYMVSSSAIKLGVISNQKAIENGSK